MQLHAIIIKFITKNSCYDTKIKNCYRQKNHYLHIFARIIRQIDDQTIDFQLIQCQAIVCTMNILMWVWYCILLRCEAIFPQYWLILLRNCGAVVVLLTMLWAVSALISFTKVYFVYLRCVYFVWRWFTFDTSAHIHTYTNTHVHVHTVNTLQ